MDINSLMGGYVRSVSYKEKRASRLRYSFYKKLTRRAMPLFFRGQDIISISPLANGSYDSGMSSLMGYFAGHGFQDFLIDIGANIGLVSCESGHHFKEIHLFEPNPYAACVLKANCFIALKSARYEIHEYGLGARNETLKLHVPYDNWGGAFVVSPENAYDLDQLSAKDGYGKFDLKNYGLVDVPIRNASSELQALFLDLSSRGLKKGVVKIDVEGLDGHMIDQLIASLPSDFSLMVFFENRDENQTAEGFIQNHPSVDVIYRMTSSGSVSHRLPRWLRSILMWWKDDEKIILSQVQGRLGIGDFIFSVG